MSQFDFLEQDFPELYQLCNDAEKYQNTDSGIALLKARQALEYIVRQNTIGGYENEDLFDGINELNDEGIINRDVCSLFHNVRRIANEGVHEKTVNQANLERCLNDLFAITDWYADYKKTQSDFNMSNNAGNLEAPINKKCEINPLETINVIDFNSDNDIENEFEKDVFETEEEYAERIAAHEPIQIGYGILDPKNTDDYTKIIFLKFHLDKIDGIECAPIMRFMLYYPINLIMYMMELF